MGEPGGLLSMGLHRVGHDWRDLAAAANYRTKCNSSNYKASRKKLGKYLPDLEIYKCFLGIKITNNKKNYKLYFIKMWTDKKYL